MIIESDFFRLLSKIIEKGLFLVFFWTKIESERKSFFGTILDDNTRILLYYYSKFLIIGTSITAIPTMPELKKDSSPQLLGFFTIYQYYYYSISKDYWDIFSVPK